MSNKNNMVFMKILLGMSKIFLGLVIISGVLLVISKAQSVEQMFYLTLTVTTLLLVANRVGDLVADGLTDILLRKQEEEG